MAQLIISAQVSYKFVICYVYSTIYIFFFQAFGFL